LRAEIQKNVRFNFAVGIVDGAFFGIGLGFASYATFLPLFISTLTDSGLLLGLVGAMHYIGWQLPQLLTANLVARMRRYKPLVMLLTLNERVPFLALALVAVAVPAIGTTAALILALLCVTWQAMGGGLTATAWQSMIAKIMPPERRGTFYGVQSAAANGLSSGSALVAGMILVAAGGSSQGFALCFLLAAVLMMASFLVLGMTREPLAPAEQVITRTSREFWNGLRDILRRDTSFRAFLGVRMVAQFATIGVSFFAVYAARRFQADLLTAGLMTGILGLSKTISNPLFGWLGDRYSHRLMFGVGVALAGASAGLALAAPQVEWFYLVFALVGFADAATWTTVMAMTAEYGKEEERPYYIGLANTLIAPATILAPLIGGWLVDHVSYQATFALAVVGAVVAVVLVRLMPEPRERIEHLFAPTPYAEVPLGMDEDEITEIDKANVGV
jgi:MFS family permease